MVAFHDKSSVFNSTSGGTTVIPLPIGAVPTDRLIYIVGSIGTSPVITDPIGPIKVAEFAPGSTLKTALYYKDVIGDEPSDYTWTWSANGRNFGYCWAIGETDNAAAPLYTVVSGAAASPGPLASTGIACVSGDWLISLVAGRENPGTDDPKTWTTDGATDAERFDNYSTNTGTGAKLTAAGYDSNGSVATGTIGRNFTCTKTIAQSHVWAVRMRVYGGVDPGPSGGNPFTNAGLPQR